MDKYIVLIQYNKNRCNKTISDRKIYIDNCKTNIYIYIYMHAHNCIFV